MKIIKLAVAFALVTLFSFSFSSCKNCNGNKGKDNGKDNGKNKPVTDRDKDNPITDGDKDKDNLDNPADEDKSIPSKDNPDSPTVPAPLSGDLLTAELEAAQLTEVDKKMQLFEAKAKRLMKDAYKTLDNSFQARRDERLGGVRAAFEAAAALNHAIFRVFHELMPYIDKEGLRKGQSNKVYKRTERAEDVVYRAMQEVYEVSMRASKNKAYLSAYLRYHPHP